MHKLVEDMETKDEEEDMAKDQAKLDKMTKASKQRLDQCTCYFTCLMMKLNMMNGGTFKQQVTPKESKLGLLRRTIMNK